MKKSIAWEIASFAILFVLCALPFTAFQPTGTFTSLLFTIGVDRRSGIETTSHTVVPGFLRLFGVLGDILLAELLHGGFLLFGRWESCKDKRTLPQNYTLKQILFVLHTVFNSLFMIAYRENICNRLVDKDTVCRFNIKY